jgi:hypothetical protein
VARKLLCALALAVALPARADYDYGDMRLAPLADPVRVDFPAADAPSGEKLRQVVAAVGPSRDWRIVSQSEGRLELERSVRDKHMLRVSLDYDARGFRLRYLQSVNLMYRELERGGAKLPLIHHNYNSWVHELAAAIASGLGVGAPPVDGFASLDNVQAVPYLRENGRKAYGDFLGRTTPRAFAIAPNGAWGFSAPAPGVAYVRRDRFDPIENALERCNRRGDGQCRLYAVDSRVVWRPAKGDF